jgi:hypothetical protein
MTLVLGRFRGTPETRHKGLVFWSTGAAGAAINFLLWWPAIFNVPGLQWAGPGTMLFSILTPLVLGLVGLAALIVPLHKVRKAGFLILIGFVGWSVGSLLVALVGGLINGIDR